MKEQPATELLQSKLATVTGAWSRMDVSIGTHGPARLALFGPPHDVFQLVQRGHRVGRKAGREVRRVDCDKAMGSCVARPHIEQQSAGPLLAIEIVLTEARVALSLILAAINEFLDNCAKLDLGESKSANPPVDA